ncbi:PREDICTED: WD repeat-containing protein 6 [Papilio xuthus]|uniref:tRNA (34-2'-O)-methyltransferase regulator WDR6 n=1 Tax=Papilio xuthus TaxID=66420 RepID=A0AAJ6Z6K9_PAPXU|nr:PREDICTED: WD repeat-containing protein 6 [Papilio xuthus]
MLAIKIAMLFTGIGSSFHIYKKDTLKVFSVFNKILHGQKINGIEPSKDGLNMFIYGGKHFTIVKRLNGQFESIDICLGSTVCDDWLHSGTWLSDTEVGLLSAHNVVQIWDVSGRPILRSETIGRDNSILYSGLLLPLLDDVLVLSGTVSSQIIISRCKKEQPLHYLLGHKGVIFSISCCLKKKIIVTTSDDRSVRIWSVYNSIENYAKSQYWDDANVTCLHELYGHSARVMRSCISEKYIVSVGEDGCICYWDYNGTLLKRLSNHQNAPIWSVSIDKDHLVTGGGDGSIILHPLTAITSFSETETVKISEGNPKKIFFTARRNAVILKESGNLIYYNIFEKEEIEFDLKHDNTYILISLSLCKQIIAVADICGNLTIFIENCKGTPTMTSIISTKLPIDKILSMDWAGNRHLVICSGSGDIYVIASKDNEVEIISKHLLPDCKERWLTAVALNIDNMLVVGDRCGNIHFYTKEELNPFKTLNKVHGRYGPTSIRIKSNEVITTGRDSTLKCFSLLLNNGVYNIKLTSTKDVGFPWVEKCIGHDDLFCGFHEQLFIITNVRNYAKLIEVSCGGGHRSWDVVRYINYLNFKCDEMIKFMYLKNSDINIMTFKLNKIVSKNIIKGTHTKEINCLKCYIPKIDNSIVLFISGGEDTTLRISTSSKEVNFQDEVILKHLSSVKTFKTFPINTNKLLVVSGGGRAQICIKTINLSKDGDKIIIKVEEFVDFLVKGTDKERKGDKTWRNCTIDFDPETRIMDLEIVEIDKNIFNIYTGCSDAFIRIFQFKYEEESFKQLGQVKYHKTCILKTHCIKYFDQTILITCSTIGEICFWDVTDPNTSSEMENFLVLTSNKSGINCIATRIISEHKVIIATGGDDNAIHIQLLDIQNKDFKTAKITQSWSSDQFHSSQITGILIIDDFFISTSIDQRITVFKTIDENNDLKFVAQKMTDIADVQGMDFIQRSEYSATVCVYGKGLEVLSVPLLGRY